jgi:hypothetical protein
MRADGVDVAARHLTGSARVRLTDRPRPPDPCRPERTISASSAPTPRRTVTFRA